MANKSISDEAIGVVMGNSKPKKSGKGTLDLVQQYGVTANNEKSIGRAFFYMCNSLTWYLICKLRGDTYTAISSVSDVEDIATQEALKKILEVVVKPTLNQYSLDNDMPTRETKSGGSYPLMNHGLAKPIFKCLGKNYMTKGKDPQHVLEKPKGSLPSDLAEMLSDAMPKGLELDSSDL